MSHLHPYDSVRDRYNRDPAFHAAVDCIRQWVEEMRLTPTETREAAMLACIMVEERRVEPYWKIVSGKVIPVPR
jgi:hypothetical protein